MWRRVLTFGAMAAIVITGTISSLLVLDVFTAPELRDMLGKTLLVIGIITTTILLLIAVAKLGMGRKSIDHAASRPTP